MIDIHFKDNYKGTLDSQYYVPQSALSAPTSVQTANQLSEATSRLNAGVLGVDLAPINPEIFEQIPKQHFKEINRLMEMNDAKASLHGPIVDLAGFSQQRHDELLRKQTEKQVEYFVDRAHDLDPKGNTPINFHINTAIPGESWRKLSKDEVKAEGIDKLSKQELEGRGISKERGYGYEVNERMGIVNQDTGQLNVIDREVKHFPGGEEVWTPERRLMSLNKTQWDEEKLRILEFQRYKGEVMDRLTRLEQQAIPLRVARDKMVLSEDEKKRLKEIEGSIALHQQHMAEFDTHVQTGLSELHHKLQYVPEKYKNKVDDLMKDVRQDFKVVDRKFNSLVNQYQNKLDKANTEQDKLKVLQDFSRESTQITEKPLRDLQLKLGNVGASGGIPSPELWTSTNKIAKDKTAETLSNVVFNAYKKYKSKTPLITLENYYQDLTLGSAKDMKATVEETRDLFSKKLVKEFGMSEERAKREAEKTIGVTWDVGHINVMRKHGYSEKEILKELKKVAPMVKQLHITDNFGFTDAHLPPGMGNAPIGKELEALKKKGFKFEKGNVIVESGSFVAQFKENPHLYAAEYFGSSLYTEKRAPYWPEMWETEGVYGLGYGPIFPEVHFREMYGAGFSNLPISLGGQAGEDRSRFAGTPNE